MQLRVDQHHAVLGPVGGAHRADLDAGGRPAVVAHLGDEEGLGWRRRPPGPAGSRRGRRWASRRRCRRCPPRSARPRCGRSRRARCSRPCRRARRSRSRCTWWCRPGRPSGAPSSRRSRRPGRRAGGAEAEVASAEAPSTVTTAPPVSLSVPERNSRRLPLHPSWQSLMVSSFKASASAGRGTRGRPCPRRGRHVLVEVDLRELGGARGHLPVAARAQGEGAVDGHLDHRAVGHDGDTAGRGRPRSSRSGARRRRAWRPCRARQL